MFADLEMKRFFNSSPGLNSSIVMITLYSFC